MCAEDSNEIPSKFLDLRAIPLKSPTAALADALETCRANLWASPVISSERVVKSEALGSFCSISIMEVMSPEDDDDLCSSDEEGEQRVQNIMLCSFAHHACSPLVQRVLTRRTV